MINSLCFMKLRSAVKIISVIIIVVSFALSVVFSIELYSIKPVTSDNELHERSDGLKYAFCLTIAKASFICSGLLLLGTIKERHELFLPWLIYFTIVLTHATLLSLFLFVLSFSPLPFFKYLMPATIFGLFLPLGILMYIHYGIYSLYKQTKFSHTIAMSVPKNDA